MPFSLIVKAAQTSERLSAKTASEGDIKCVEPWNDAERGHLFNPTIIIPPFISPVYAFFNFPEKDSHAKKEHRKHDVPSSAVFHNTIIVLNYSAFPCCFGTFFQNCAMLFREAC